MWIQILMIAIGFVLAIIMGVMGLLMNTRRAKRLANLIGEGATRVIYFILGIALIGLGIYGIINPDIFSK